MKREWNSFREESLLSQKRKPWISNRPTLMRSAVWFLPGIQLSTLLLSQSIGRVLRVAAFHRQCMPLKGNNDNILYAASLAQFGQLNS